MQLFSVDSTIFLKQTITPQKINKLPSKIANNWLGLQVFSQKSFNFVLRRQLYSLFVKTSASDNHVKDTMNRFASLIVHLFCLNLLKLIQFYFYCLQSSRNLTLGAATRLLHSFFDQDQLLPSPLHPPLLLWPFWPLPPEHWIAWGLIQSFHEPRKGYGRLHPYGHESMN